MQAKNNSLFKNMFESAQQNFILNCNFASEQQKQDQEVSQQKMQNYECDKCKKCFECENSFVKLYNDKLLKVHLG